MVLRSMWQDYVIAVGQMVLNLALLPTVISGVKMPVVTCALTSGVLLVFSGTLLTLSAEVASATSLVGAILWGTLLYHALRA